MMLDGVHMAREAAQRVRRASHAESQAAALTQVALDKRLKVGGLAHAADPGHGSATALRFLLSSLA